MKTKNFARSKRTPLESNEAITFEPSGRTVKASEASSVLEVALRYGVELNHSCGGMGSCTTCRVYVEKGLLQLPERTELEQERAEERVFADNERLACQIPALPGLVVKIP